MVCVCCVRFGGVGVHGIVCLCGFMCGCVYVCPCPCMCLSLSLSLSCAKVSIRIDRLIALSSFSAWCCMAVLRLE